MNVTCCCSRCCPCCCCCCRTGYTYIHIHTVICSYFNTIFKNVNRVHRGAQILQLEGCVNACVCVCVSECSSVWVGVHMCMCVFGNINKFSERKLNCFKLVSTWSGEMIWGHFHDRLLFIRHRKGSYQSRRSAWCCASSIDASWSSSHRTRRRECRSAWGTSSCQRTEKSAKDQRITISLQWEASFK